MATVGIIANPAAGKDIRRLVAHGRLVPEQEKVNVLRRLLAGLEASGVERAVVMPDAAMLGRMAADGSASKPAIEFLEMPVFNEERDSSMAAELMAKMGVGCVVTLGGDGTNRAVAKGSGDVPLVPVSTGTNNVFSTMTEGTVAGLAAGVVARGLVELQSVTTVCNVLEVAFDGGRSDIALVDVAVCKHGFVGARAIWEVEMLSEVFLTSAEPTAIGLSAIGAQLHPAQRGDAAGLHVRIGEGGTAVLAPIAPGVISSVPVSGWSPLQVDQPVEVSTGPWMIALDGERSFSVKSGESVQVTLRGNGPRVVSVEAALREAASAGVFREESGTIPRRIDRLGSEPR